MSGWRSRIGVEAETQVQPVVCFVNNPGWGVGSEV